MTIKRMLLRVLESDREAFGDAFRDLSERVHNGSTVSGDPVKDDPVSGMKWLQNNYVRIDSSVTGVPIHFQTMQEPCIVLPPFDLLKNPLPPVGYTFPQFYCDQCRTGGPASLEFYLKRLSDYTLSHCG